MALMVRPEPFSREVDRLFDAFFGQQERTGRRWVPPMDLVEADDHFVLKADLPGLRDEDVKIEVQDGTLTISGERKAEHEARERLVPDRALVRRVQPLADAARARRRERDQRGLPRRRSRGPHPEARGAQAAADRDPSNGGNGTPAAVEGSAQES